MAATNHVHLGIGGVPELLGDVCHVRTLIQAGIHRHLLAHAVSILETTLAVDQCRHVAASFAVLAGVVAVWPLFSSEIPPSRSGPLS